MYPLPYSTCKPSGDDSLGEVPEHWDICRLKRVCRLEYGDSLDSESRILGGTAVYGSNGVVGHHNEANTVAPCIVIGRKGSFGKVNFSYDSIFAIDTTFFVDARYSSANMRWLYYLLGWLRLDAVTKDSAIPGLDREDVYRRLAPLPKKAEQSDIARFLDHVTDQFERYIRAKEELIALLEKQKQVVIHDAVTGRIDVRTGQPYPAYKPSGTKWLKDVPMHWDVIKLKYWLTVNQHTLSKDTDPDRMFDYIDIGSVGTGYLITPPEKLRFRDSPSRARRVVRSGDTIISTVRTYLKAVWYASDVESDLVASTGFAVFTPNPGTFPKFINYLCQSEHFASRVTANSVGVAYPAIAETKLENLQIGVPTLVEQTAIARFLDKVVAKLASAINRSNREIELLREYRTRLIADVVTGKLDVREAAANLPELEAIADSRDGKTTAEPDSQQSNTSLHNKAPQIAPGASP